MPARKTSDSLWYVTKRIGKAMFTEEMLGEEAPVLVGLSGGFASMALLKGMVERRKRVPWKHPLVPAFVADIVHGPSEKVEAVLREWCAGLGLELLVDSRLAPVENHWLRVPHGERLAALARCAGAPYVALGHTIVDRAVWLLEAMVNGGEISEIPTKEAVEVDGRHLTVVRPISLIATQAALDAANEEALPWCSRTVEPPHHELKKLLADFVLSKKGAPLEKLMNVVNAPARINRKYMA